MIAKKDAKQATVVLYNMKKFAFYVCLFLALMALTIFYVRSFSINAIAEQKLACCIEVFKKLETGDFNQALNKTMRKLTDEEQVMLMTPLGFNSGVTYASGAVALWIDTSGKETCIYFEKIEFK